MRACRGLGLGCGSRRSRRSPTLGLSRPASLGGSLLPTPRSCSLLRTMWPRRCLASGPAAACGPRSSELPPGLGTAQPGLGAPILPRICSVPKCNPSYQRSRPESVSPAPSPYRGPPGPTPPAKYRTFPREQMSDGQAHGQTHRHSHSPTPGEAAGRGKFINQSQSPSTCERPGPEEGTGDAEAERDEGSETDSKTARGRCRQTDMSACTHVHAYSHREAQMERQKHRATDRKLETDTGESMASDPRQTHWRRS